ncbi:MAG: GNAT family N-acetyltransferase [Lachnospiraceae bacterium]|nr:GNAT family N-acetyltransferase [Lachnospiraceae bacterium]
MNRIYIVSSNRKKDIKFAASMAKSGIEVLYAKDASDYDPKTDLLMTDIPKVADSINKSLILIDKESDLDNFPNSVYFVMNPEENEADYFIKIWQRFHDIPWTIAKTERLTLRETVEEDVDAFYEMYKDPDMTRYTEKLYEDIEDEKKYVREYRDRVYAVQGFGIWTVIRTDDGAIIGRAGLITRAGFEDAEVGFAIGTAYQRKGYAYEAVSECIKIAKKLEFEKVYALTMPENEPSTELLKKLGFSFAKAATVDRTVYEKWEKMLRQ